MSLLKQSLLNDVTLSPAQITVSQNDYGPTGFDFADIIRLDASGAVNITGLDATNVADSLFKSKKLIINTTANTITLKHQDVASAAANRLLCPGGADLALGNGYGALVYYDETTTNWRVYDVSVTGAGEANTASNVGTGVGVFKQKNVLDLEFKTLLAGYAISLTSGTNEITVALNSTVTTLTDGATIAVDAAVGPNYQVTLGGNRTLSNPTNAAAGQELWIAVAQDGTGGRTLAFDTDFIAADGSVTVNATASAVSLVHAVARDFGGGVKWYYTVMHASETGGGEANTASNVGTGTGWFKQKTAVDLEFKTAIAGYGLTLSSGTNENTYAFDTVVTTLTDGATIAVDADAGPHYEVTIAGNRTLSNPTNGAEGKMLVIAVKQDATGGRTLAFDTDFINAGSKYQVALAANAVSIVIAQARDFGATVSWYYTIHHAESVYAISPAAITANQIGYAPTGWSAADTARISSDASRNISGFSATVDQKKKLLINVGANNIVIKHQDVTETTAANRIICPGGSDITLSADDALSLEYDSTTARWRAV